ncbi:MAG: hypothetical protein M0C28_36465 [Candidatus Moduliflexus flocculans]|nr:hypothetical protein [Candidatus Moduliflexus flocculans]
MTDVGNNRHQNGFFIQRFGCCGTSDTSLYFGRLIGNDRHVQQGNRKRFACARERLAIASTRQFGTAFGFAFAPAG